MNLDAKEVAETHPTLQQHKSFSECEEAFDKLDLRKFVIDYIHKHPEEFVEKDDV